MSRPGQHSHAPILLARKERTLRRDKSIERLDHCRCGKVRVMVFRQDGTVESTGWREPAPEKEASRG